MRLDAVAVDGTVIACNASHAAALVHARLQRFDRRLEEASSDPGARPWQAYFVVTLPDIRSAVIGSALLSFDEIPVPFFLTGRDNTLPLYIHSTVRRGIMPEINAVDTVIVVLSPGLIVLSVRLLRDARKRRPPSCTRAAAAPPTAWDLVGVSVTLAGMAIIVWGGWQA